MNICSCIWSSLQFAVVGKLWINHLFFSRLLSDHVREFSCGKLYYRTFLLDEKQDVLYVGAM